MEQVPEPEPEPEPPMEEPEPDPPPPPRERFLGALYFGPDEAELDGAGLALLDAAGAELLADPSLRLVIRGHTAEAGNEEGRAAVSEARVQAAGIWLLENYPLGRDRLVGEPLGSRGTPKGFDGSPESRRCVELTLVAEEQEE